MRSTAPTLCITAEGRIDRQTLSGKVVAQVADICGRAGVQCIAVGGIVEPVAAEELRRRGCETHEQGDLERAGRELASRLVLALGLSACSERARRCALAVGTARRPTTRRPIPHRPRYRLTVASRPRAT